MWTFIYFKIMKVHKFLDFKITLIHIFTYLSPNQGINHKHS